MKSSVPQKQRDYYSGKKKRHTLKVQIVADASTRDVLCISVGKGSQHDFKLFQESKVHFSPQIQAIADKGYQGIKKLHANSVTPIKAKRGEELSALEKIYNSVVSKCRICYEVPDVKRKRGKKNLTSGTLFHS